MIEHFERKIKKLANNLNNNSTTSPLKFKFKSSPSPSKQSDGIQRYNTGRKISSENKGMDVVSRDRNGREGK